MLALGVVDVFELLPVAHASAADDQSSVADVVGAGAARGVVGLLPDFQASASDAQSSFAGAVLRGVVVVAGAARASLDTPQSSTAAGWLVDVVDLDPPRDGVLPPLGAALAPVAHGLLELPELPQSSALLELVVVFPLDVAQASALAPQSSLPPVLDVELVFGVDGLEEDPQSSVVDAVLPALGVVLPRPEEVVPDAQASAEAPQSSPEATPVADDLELGVVFAAVRLDVTEPQAFVAAFQSSGSLLAGAADRDVLEPLAVLPTPQSSATASHESEAPLDEPK